MILSVLIILVVIESADASSCYECSSSSYRTCDSSLSTEECSGGGSTRLLNNNNKCYWLTYTKSLGTNKDERFNDYGFLKGCVPPQTQCHKLCDFYLGKGYEECKVQCCDGDLCNKDSFVRVFERRATKRSSSASTTRQTSGTPHSIRWRTKRNHLFIACLTLIYVCLYKLLVVL